MRRGSSALTVVLALVFGLVGLAQAAGPKRPEPPADPWTNLKRAAYIEPIENRFIVLSDPKEPGRAYGQNIYHRLITRLHQSGKVAVFTDGEVGPASLALAITSAAPDPAAPEPDPCLLSIPPVPSARLRAFVSELSFATGTKGTRVFSGFRPGFENPFNRGEKIEEALNEFPVPLGSAAGGPFGVSYADTGGLYSGMELGHEINFDLLLFGASLKKAEYDARISLTADFVRRLGATRTEVIQSRGTGFYMDLSAHLTYQGADFSAGVMLARKAALLEAFEKTMNELVTKLAADLEAQPLVARTAGVCESAQMLGVGHDYRLTTGARFYNRTQWERGIVPEVAEVERVYARTAKLRFPQAEPRSAIGDEWVALKKTESPPPLAPVGLALVAGDGLPFFDSVDAPAGNLGVIGELLKFVQGFFERLFRGLWELLTLPYRLWRFGQYDQPYRGGEIGQVSAGRALALASRTWALQKIGVPEAWRSCQGDRCLGTNRVIVAVIDTGVDYNHPELRRNIFFGGSTNSPGWDFFADDPRPYDDHSHGTEVASVIAGGGGELIGVAPRATILPVRAIGPYGVASSAAIFEGVRYSVEQGAKIIVLPWATAVDTKTAQAIVDFTATFGALLVIAAGDEGIDLRARARQPVAAAAGREHALVVAGAGRDGSLLRRVPVGGGDGDEALVSSNYGSLVDLAAPAEAVNVARPRGHRLERSHTGLAAGFVAGAAALLWARCERLNARQVRELLLSGAAEDPALRGELGANKALFLPGALRAATSLQSVCTP